MNNTNFNNNNNNNFNNNNINNDDDNNNNNNNNIIIIIIILLLIIIIVVYSVVISTYPAPHMSTECSQTQMMVQRLRRKTDKGHTDTYDVTETMRGWVERRGWGSPCRGWSRRHR